MEIYRRIGPDPPHRVVSTRTDDTSPRIVVAPAAPDEATALARAMGVPRLVGHLLWSRGVRDRAAATSFLTPRLADLVSPDVLPDMALAAARVARAVRGGEPIAVCGDYDVDGMTGTALLVRFLRLAGGTASYAIPDRVSDGYGLSVRTVERLAAEGVKLLITVDNGVGAIEALERAKALGLDAVITDHHLPGPKLPPAVAIVDPHRTDGPHRTDQAAGPSSHLCGCGLAFKLAWGTSEVLQRARRDEKLKMFLVDAIGLVALATVADVMPLVGENRVLVTAGLSALRGSKSPGIRALLEVAGLSAATLTAEDIAWRLAPRLNAAGRMNHPEHAIDLFTTDDPELAATLAQELESANEQRKEIERGITQMALIEAGSRVEGRRSLVVSGEGWHRGVIGIVAARLVDAHARPTVVIGFEGSGGRGSCRTTGGVNLVEALTQCGAFLTRYGGHAAAAGLEVDRSRLIEFEAAFEEAVRAQQGDVTPERTVTVDAEVSPSEFNLDTAEQIRRLAPFGSGNPEPRFLLRGVRLAGRAKLMGAGSAHLSFVLQAPTGGIRVVAFRQANAFDLVSSGTPFDMVATPTVNEWRGVRTPEFQASSIRPSAPA